MKRNTIIKRLLAAALCLCMGISGLSGFNILASDPDPVADNTKTNGIIESEYVVDGDTTDSYRNLIALRDDSQKAGRVWADKSVFKDSIKLDMDTDGYVGEIGNNSDFLHVFSALGSSQVVNTKETVPLDVVFILDFSTSMANTYYQADSRFQQTVDAVNDAINTIISLSPDSRVGIATYGKTATKLMPLVKPVPDEGKADTQWLEITKYDFPDLNDVSTAVIKNKNAKRATSASGWEDITINNTVTLTGATNLQAGLAAGMGMLADDPVTTWKSPISDKEYGRIPVVMVMTDGGCNTLCTSTDKTVENDAAAWYATKYDERRNTYADDDSTVIDSTGKDASDTIGTVITPTLLTAAYNTARIDANYAAKTAAHDKTNVNGTGVAYVYGIGVDIDSLSARMKPYALPKVNATLNPLKWFNGNPPYDWNVEHTDEIKRAYGFYQDWVTGNETVDVGRLRDTPYTGQDPPSVEMYVSQLPANHSPSKQDVINNLNYTDAYEEINAEGLGELFIRLIRNISGTKGEVFTPVGGTNDVGVSDALSYMDPIGKYMEVKTVKNVLLFGEMYDVTKKGEPKYYFRDGREATAESYAYSEQYYTIAGEDKMIANPCYGENSGKTFMLSDIEIYVKDTGNYQDDVVGGGGIESDTGNDSALHVNIPANALPMQVANILIDNDSVIYNTNVEQKTQSTPIRVFYEVGIADEIRTANKNIDMTKVDPDYINSHKVEDGDSNMVYFYSNWYANKQYTDYVDGELKSYDFGDPVLSFSLNEDNSYYLFQDYVPLVDTSGNKIRAMEKNSTYRIPFTYYTAAGEKVDTWSEQKTGDFGSKPGDTDAIALAYGDTLCWYNPETKQVLSYLGDDRSIVRNPPEGYYIAAEKGAIAMGDMSKNAIFKAADGNPTETSDTFYLPTYSSANDADTNKTVINVYLGNNGRLAVSNTQLLVMKTVENDDDNSISADETFEYTIQLKGQKIPEQAIKATREDDGTWRALIESIELITNNKGLLVYNDRELVAVDGNGSVIDDPGEDPENYYYIYIGGVAAADNFSYTLFDSKRGDSFHGMLGNNTELHVAANLVSAALYEEQGSEWNYNESLRVKTIDPFPVGYVGFDSGTQIGFAVHMYYQSQSKYQTEQLNFDETGRADFKLRDGEGLLFTGLDSGTEYTVTEKLTQDQFDAGISLNKVEHTVNEGVKEDTHLHPASSVSGDHHKFGDKTYSVSGDTTASLTERVHYINHPPKTSKRWIPSDDRGYVDVGDEVTYVIHWINDQVDAENKPIPADITITDPLDMGVEFVSAEFVEKETVQDGGNTKTTYKPIDDAVWKAKGWSWSYDENSRTVTWKIKAEEEESGIVRLTVKVNANAAVIDDKGNPLENPDNKVVNRARTVINGVGFDTNIVETPLNEFKKREVSVEDNEGKITPVSEEEGNLKQDDETGYFVGPLVEKGYKITYDISYTNYKSTTATVTITDRLDPDVAFYSASYGGVTLNDGNPNIVDRDDVWIEYDPETRVVKWTIFNVESFASGKVSLTVEVTSDAVGGGGGQSEPGLAVPEGPQDFEFYPITDNVLDEGVYIIVNGSTKKSVNNTLNDSSFNTVTINNNMIEDIEDKSIMWIVDHSDDDSSFYLRNADNNQYLKCVEAYNGAKSWVDNKDGATEWIIRTDKGNSLSFKNDNTFWLGWYSWFGTDRFDIFNNNYNHSATMTFYKLVDGGFGDGDNGDSGDDSDDGLGWMGAAGDFLIDNRAYVQIDDDEKQETETMENPLLGTLAVKKLVLEREGSEPTYDGRTFEFTITLEMPAGSDFDPQKHITGADGITWSNNGNTYEITVRLKHGESVKIEHIPYNTQYSVKEKEDDEFPLYSAAVSGMAYENADQGVSGKIEAGKTEVVFNNAPKDYIPPIDLPTTGGKGVTIILIAGVNILAAALYIRSRRRKNKCI